MILALKILGGVLALALGIYMGWPGEYTQSQQEIDDLLADPHSRRHKVRQRFTFLNIWKSKEKGSDRRIREGQRRRPFKM